MQTKRIIVSEYQYIKQGLWCLWVFLHKLMSELVSNASVQHEPGSRVWWQITPRCKIFWPLPPPLHPQTRQRAPNNHILDLVVVCMLSPLRTLSHVALLLIWLHMATLVPHWKDNWMATFWQHMKTGQHACAHLHTVHLHGVKVHLAVVVVAIPWAHPGQGQPAVIWAEHLWCRGRVWLGSLQHGDTDACEHELGLLPIDGDQQGVCLLPEVLFFDDMCDLDEGIACIGHGNSGAEAEGDLDNGHGEAVARVHIVCVVWGCKACVCVDEAVVDEHGMHCMGCGQWAGSSRELWGYAPMWFSGLLLCPTQCHYLHITHTRVQERKEQEGGGHDVLNQGLLW